MYRYDIAFFQVQSAQLFYELVARTMMYVRDISAIAVSVDISMSKNPYPVNFPWFLNFSACLKHLAIDIELLEADYSYIIIIYLQSIKKYNTYFI